MKISVIGTGYVGLVTGACFADMGNEVCCLDVDEAKVQELRKGSIPIFEPGLDAIVLDSLEKERLFFTTSYETAVNHGEVIFISVGTPPLDDGEADLTNVINCSTEIGRFLKGYKIIVNKSTVPIGTHQLVEDTILGSLKEENKQDTKFDVVSNPEFLKEGEAVNDFRKPDRIIIGSSSEKAFKKMKELYRPFNRQNDRLLEMDNLSAEMTKYASNALLATKISFMNEMAQISERLGVDIENVRRGVGTDKRIGNSFLYSGVGFGGSCFPKDIKALSFISHKNNYEPKILQAIQEINNSQKKILFDKAMHHYKKDLKSKTFSIWGLSFKPGTDDLREAPSLVLIDLLLQAGAKVKVFDPVSMKNFEEIYNHSEVIYCAQAEDVFYDSYGLFLLTEWKEFRTLNIESLKSRMKNPVIFDGRNIYDQEELEMQNIPYYGIGRGRSIY